MCALISIDVIAIFIDEGMVIFAQVWRELDVNWVGVVLVGIVLVGASILVGASNLALQRLDNNISAECAAHDCAIIVKSIVCVL